MKYKTLYVMISFILHSFTCISCNPNDSKAPLTEAPFTIEQDAANPHFVTFTAESTEPDASFEWIFPKETKVSNMRSTVFYFDKKGTYEITLNQIIDGKKGSSTKKITLQQDSYYYGLNEQLWWNDEFSATKIDVTNWNYDQGIGKWGNNEWQNYTNKPDNSFIRDGKLVLKAIKSGAGQKEGDYTSARLTTKGKREISEGRVEVRARLAGGVGLWPAIWFFGTKASPHYSELDIMEYVGCDKNIIYGAIHTTATLESAEKVSSSKVVPGVEDNFHIYGMNWTKEKIEFYLDTPNNVYLTFSPSDKSNPRIWPFNSELYLIVNIAVGGDWGGMKGVDDTIFPREMEIDYVRVFKRMPK